MMEDEDIQAVEYVTAHAERREPTRNDRAFTLFCQGMRPAAIAAELEVSVGTVRRWLRQDMQTLAQEALVERAAQVQTAIESQRAIAAAAWAAYEHERALEDALLRGELDRVRRRAVRRDGDATSHRASRAGRGPRRVTDQTAVPAESAGALDDSDTSDEADANGASVILEEYERPRHASQGAKYLAVAQAAQREVARLQGLYARIEQAVPEARITITRRPDGPENRAPTGDDTDAHH